MNLIERFAQKFEVRSLAECWPWKGSRKPDGYGNFKLHGRALNAHRVMWIFEHGPISDTKILVCHTCDNRSCVNPNHLFLGTHSDNAQDMKSKGRGRGGRLSARPWLRKFSDEEISIIRKLNDEGYSSRNIANQFGCSHSSIQKIYKRKTYYV
jgi:hypothetical protein